MQRALIKVNKKDDENVNQALMKQLQEDIKN
jgi:hypothetical protein